MKIGRQFNRRYTIAAGRHGAPWWTLPGFYLHSKPITRFVATMVVDRSYCFIPHDRRGRHAIHQVNKGPGITGLLGPDKRSVRLGWVSDWGYPDLLSFCAFVEGDELQGRVENGVDFWHVQPEAMAHVELPHHPIEVTGVLSCQDGRWGLESLSAESLAGHPRLQQQQWLRDTWQRQAACPVGLPDLQAGWVGRVRVGGNGVAAYPLRVSSTVSI